MAASRVWSFHQLPVLNTSSLFCGISQRNISKNKTILRKLGFPEKPKLPSNSFILFSAKIRSQIQAKNPEMSMPEIAKIASTKWKALTEDERNMYRDEFRRNLVNYRNEVELYNSSITETQKLQMKELIEGYKISKHDKSAAESLKKLSKELNKPKKPLTAFLLFKSKQIGNNSNSGLSMQERMKLLGEQWNKISESEKEKYRTEYKQNLEQYKKDIREWEEKMIKEGHANLVTLNAFKIYKDRK